jgi:hypothetical protein
MQSGNWPERLFQGPGFRHPLAEGRILGKGALVQYKKLADTNFRVPEIGLDTWEYRGGVDPYKSASPSAHALLIPPRYTALRR